MKMAKSLRKKDVFASLPFVEGEAPRGYATGGGDASPNNR
jgi:hypothetical protein